MSGKLIAMTEPPTIVTSDLGRFAGHCPGCGCMVGTAELGRRCPRCETLLVEGKLNPAPGSTGPSRQTFREAVYSAPFPQSPAGRAAKLRRAS